MIEQILTVVPAVEVVSYKLTLTQYQLDILVAVTGVYSQGPSLNEQAVTELYQNLSAYVKTHPVIINRVN
jgi:hypothetical protein